MSGDLPAALDHGGQVRAFVISLQSRRRHGYEIVDGCVGNGAGPLGHVPPDFMHQLAMPQHRHYPAGSSPALIAVRQDAPTPG